jgi:hypothetical protein
MDQPHQLGNVQVSVPLLDESGPTIAQLDEASERQVLWYQATAPASYISIKTNTSG